MSKYKQKQSVQNNNKNSCNKNMGQKTKLKLYA